MKTIQDIIDAALAEKLERSNNHQLILDKQKQIKRLEVDIGKLRENSMEGYELQAITDLNNEIYAQWEEKNQTDTKFFPEDYTPQVLQCPHPKTPDEDLEPHERHLC